MRTYLNWSITSYNRVAFINDVTYCVINMEGKFFWFYSIDDNYSLLEKCSSWVDGMQKCLIQYNSLYSLLT